jgi:hypothetical protein
VRSPIDKAQLPGQLTIPKNSKTGEIISASAFYDLDFANQNHVQGVVAGPVFDKKVTVDQLALGHEGTQDLNLRICQLGAQ